jgi:UDP:flavonoid glycosyltransferase YjiC (YdhE family)
MIIINLILQFVNLVSCDDNNSFGNSDGYLDFIDEPVNILISAYIGTRSHVKFILEITQQLENFGHKVTIATPEDNLKWSDGFNITKFNMGKVDQSKLIRRRGFPGVLPPLYDQFYPRYKSIIEEKKPDVVICDFFSAACIDYCQENRIPLIVGLQALDPRLASMPYINNNVDFQVPATTEHMSFWSRWYNTFIRSDKRYKGKEEIKYELNKIRAKHGVSPRKSYIGDIDTSYKMMNSFLGWEIPRPLHPTFDLIGPVRSSKIAPLTDEFKDFLEEHEAVLYIAFGTGTWLGHTDLRLIIEASFLALKYGIVNGVILATITPEENFPEEFKTVLGIIKSKDLFNGLYPQIKISRFVPQEAILKHKSTKLHITHGGLESLFETIYTLTPALVMPFFGDQPGNSQLVVENNLGGMIDKNVDSSNKMYEEIKRIVTDEDGSIKRDLNRVRTIAHYRSTDLQQAGEKIITFAKVAKACRTDNDPKDEYPCEVKHMITVDQKISHFKAYQWDIYTLHYSFITFETIVTIHFITKLYKRYRTRGYTSIPDSSSSADNRSGHNV